MILALSSGLALTLSFFYVTSGKRYAGLSEKLLADRGKSTEEQILEPNSTILPCASPALLASVPLMRYRSRPKELLTEFADSVKQAPRSCWSFAVKVDSS